MRAGEFFIIAILEEEIFCRTCIPSDCSNDGFTGSGPTFKEPCVISLQFKELSIILTSSALSSERSVHGAALLSQGELTGNKDKDIGLFNPLVMHDISLPDHSLCH